MLSLQHIVILLLVLAVLQYMGVWPAIARALRDLRGEPPRDAPNGSQGVASTNRDLDLCYKLMGLSPSASWEAVEQAYRSKAKVHHPDRGGDGDAMRALNDAYSRIKKAHGR